jgi:hypothetical protein
MTIVTIFVQPGMGDLEGITETTGELTEVYVSRGHSWCTVGSHSFLTSNITRIQFGAPTETTIDFPTHKQLVNIARCKAVEQEFEAKFEAK